MLDKHSDVFDKDLGCMKGVEVTLEVPQPITTAHYGLTGDVMQLMDCPLPPLVVLTYKNGLTETQLSQK